MPVTLMGFTLQSFVPRDAGGIRLRCRCPHAVETAARTSGPRKAIVAAFLGSAPTPTRRPDEAQHDGPQLQGLSPHASPPLVAAVEAVRERVALLGFALQGPDSTRMVMAFARPPLARLSPRGPKSPGTTPPQGLTSSGARVPLSRPPPLMGFPTSWHVTEVRLERGPGVASSDSGVRHRPLTNPLRTV